MPPRVGNTVARGFTAPPRPMATGRFRNPHALHARPEPTTNTYNIVRFFNDADCFLEHAWLLFWPTYSRPLR